MLLWFNCLVWWRSCGGEDKGKVDVQVQLNGLSILLSFGKQTVGILRGIFTWHRAMVRIAGFALVMITVGYVEKKSVQHFFFFFWKTNN